MPVRRSSYRASRSRRSPRFKIRRTRRSTKRYAVRRPRSARRVTRKALLNVTSTKKRRDMLTVSATAPGGAYSIAPLVITPTPTTPFPGAYNSSTSIIPWIATAQDLTFSPFQVVEKQRSATTCYMRGLKETMRLETNSDCEWVWRRVSFCYRGPALTAISSPAYSDSNVGTSRLVTNYSNSASTSTPAYLFIQAMSALLFKGVFQQNWFDLMTAPIDTRRVDLKSDRTRYLRSGNGRAVRRQFHTWQPMNKNIIYDDEEAGTGENSSPFSVGDKRGMGDYYVIDFIRPVAGTGSDQLQVEADSTLYWHEK